MVEQPLAEGRLARRRGIVAVALAALVVAACGAAATPVPSPTPSPSPTVAPTPSPTPTPAASPSPLPDPSEGLAIAAPYTLEPVEPAIGAALDAAMRSALGSMATVVQVGARTAATGGVTASYVVVMRIPGVPMSSPAFLDGLATGVAGEGGKYASKTILGTSVRVVSARSGGMVVFITGDRIVIVVGAADAVELAVATAIIQANG